MIKSIIGIIFFFGIGFFSQINPVFFSTSNILLPLPVSFQNNDTIKDTTEYVIHALIPTFLGNSQRNFYGSEPPSTLNLIWKLWLGEGETIISRKLGSRIWAGAGWTGQPLLILENDKKYLIQGAYDHHLKKINANTGKVVWEYKFDDVVKGTGTFWINNYTDCEEEKYIILQGSRLGVGNYLDSKHIPSYRAISFLTGKELWRLDSKWTDSYSRDVDGSALIINDTVYIGLENSLFTVFDANPQEASIKNGMLQPKIIQELKLYKPEDVIRHKYNVVTESSPSLLDNKIYIASGSGRVFAYDLIKRDLDWEFFVGSDIDGSAIVTNDSSILVSVEKQYISGNGGVLKLDPYKNGNDAVIWYFPTGNIEFSSWEGGVIGSVSINDIYSGHHKKKLAAFAGIDGFLYVVDHQEVLNDSLVPGPDSLTLYQTPRLIFKDYIGPSISTPIIFDHKLIVPGYNGIRLYHYDDSLRFKLIDKMAGPFEATPIVDDRKIYIASRDGYLYCLGEKD